MDSDQEMSNSASASTDIVLNSVESKSQDHPVWITCYLNGNPHFAGERVLYTKKRYKSEDAFYDEITRRLCSDRSIRALGTPKRGSRLHSLLDLEEGQRYVALANDTFKRLPYTDIEKTPRRRPPRNYLEVPKKNQKYKDVTGKIHQTNIHATKIYVWPNRETIHQPHPITLLPSQMENMHEVIKHVGERLNPLTGGYVTRLYTLNGIHINDPKMLKHDDYYVAVKHLDHFMGVNYTYKQKPNFMTSQHIHKWRELPPLNLSRGSKNSKGWSPDHSGHSSYPNSENSYSQRYKRNQRQSREPREEDEVFPRKPVTHKRSSERKNHREVDLDKDEGGMFKAKHSNRHTQGAREVRDTRDTKVDLPIDQVPAEEVKDEEPTAYESTDDKTAPVPSGVELTKLPSEQNSEEPANEDEDERIRGKPNSDHNSNTQKHKSKDHREMNGYDSPTRRSPSPHNSPTPRYSRNQQYSPPQRRSSSSRYDNSRHTPDRGTPVRSPDQNDSFREKEEAAVKIQSHMKGYLTRKNLNENNNQNDRGDADGNEKSGQDDDLLQRQRDEAATKIQSHMRGYQARKNYAIKKAEKDLSAGRKSVNSVISSGQRSLERPMSAGQRSLARGSPTSPTYKEPGASEDEKHAAATKIQAHVRGYQTRKELQDRQ